MRVVVLTTLMLATPVQAQVEQPAAVPSGHPQVREGWSVTVGAAAVASPAWQGSRDMAFSIFPDLRVNYGGRFFASVPEGIGWNVVDAEGWRAGPIAKIRFGRDEDDGGSPFLISGGSDALSGMGDVKAAAEVGGFVQKSFGDAAQWRARGELRRGFGGHEGIIADLSVDRRLRLGAVRVSVGPRATIASGDFMQTYFGIDAQQSQRTGLTRYDAEGGLLSYGVGGSVIRPLGRRSALTFFTSLDRLGEPAADSPLIRERGRSTQFSLGLGYGFTL